MMKTLLKILFLLLVGFTTNAQTRPSGNPSVLSTNGWYKIAYVESDSGLIVRPRDTASFSPRFTGTIVMQPNIRRFYYYDSTDLRWYPLSSTANNGLTLTGNNIQLGGTLLQLTDINNGGFQFFLHGEGQNIFRTQFGNFQSNVLTSTVGSALTSVNTVNSLFSEVNSIAGSAYIVGGKIGTFYNEVHADSDRVFLITKSNTTPKRLILDTLGYMTLDAYPSLTQETDTTTYKPIGINSAGKTVPMAYWKGSGGAGAGLTSVGISMPSGFTVTNSPLVANGTIAISGAGTTLQYIRGNGTLATFDTTAIPNFYLKVRGLLTGTSPITFNQTTGAIGINNANTSGTKGAASFTGAFSDNGSGLIDLLTLVSAGSCTGCNLNIDAKGRITGYSAGAGGATNNTNIGAGIRPVNVTSQEMRTLFAGFGTAIDTVSNANGITWKADTTRSTGLPTYWYVDSSVAAGGGGGTVTNVSGTTNRITVTNPTTTPVIDIAATYVGQTSITTLGTIATGIWNGTAIGATFGGTGQTTVTTGDLLYGSATNTWSKLAGVATGNALISSGVATAPSWGKVGLTTHVSGVLPVANGGTGTATPSLVAGTDISITGTWPNQTINATGGGGGGVTTLAPIGSTPNSNGGTISGSTLNLQPANGSFGGVVTTIDQVIAGNKFFNSKRTTFYGPNGKSPIVNANYVPSSIVSDSFYIANKYIGFGFIDRFTSGTVVQVVFQADDHVGTNAHIRMRRSYDQGKTWATTTIDTGSTGYFVTGIGGGVTHSNRLVVFLERINSTTLAFIDQRIMYSDDEGATFSAQQIISNNSLPVFQPYGPLCKIGGDSLLLSWYGDNGAGTYNSYVIKSGDDGATWSSPITIQSSSTSQRTETSVMYLGGNTLIALARSEQADSAYGQFVSRDNGSTWTYQGITSFGQSGTPPWTKVFKGKNGKLICVTYYKTGGYTGQINATYGYADSIALGPQYWTTSRTKIIIPVVRGNAYVQVAHPNYDMYSIGTYYDETIIVDDATTKYLNVPLNGDPPLDFWETVSTGVNHPGSFVGINNIAPEGMLDIKGSEAKTGALDIPLIVASNNTTARLGAYFGIGNNATAGSRYFSIQSIEQSVGFRSLLLNPNGGNVGIGVTTAASSPLHLNSTTSGSSGYTARLFDANATIGTNVVIGFALAGTDNKYKSLSVDSDGFHIGKLPDALNAAPTNVVNIDNSTVGRVGIDVVPTARLHIEGGSSFGGTAPLKINSGTLMTTPENGAFENDGTTIYATVGGTRYPLTGATWTAVTGGINYSSGFVGIKNAAPTVSLDVKGANAKSGAVETVVSIGSSDASNALNLFIDNGNNATAGSRYMSLQAVESGVAFRPLVLQPTGSNVLIGTTTDGGEKFQVSGSAAFDLGSDATGDIYYRNSGGSFTRLPIGTNGDVLNVSSGLPAWGAGSGATTIYTGDGTLSGDRTVTGSGNDLTFLSMFNFRINANTFLLAKASPGAVYTTALVGAPNHYEVGYTPVPGVYSKGAGLYIDTNNNVGLGTIPATTLPLYATGNSTTVSGLQSSTGNFYVIRNVTANATVSINDNFITVDATGGNVTLTLPAASTTFGAGVGIDYVFKRLDNSGNSVTIQRAGSDTIDGGTSFTLTAQYESKSLRAISSSVWALH